MVDSVCVKVSFLISALLMSSLLHPTPEVGLLCFWRLIGRDHSECFFVINDLKEDGVIDGVRPTAL